MSVDGMKAKFGEAKKALMAADRICIISHRSPDGDAVGSNLALRYALEAQGKHVVSACVDPVPGNSIWLAEAKTFVQDFDVDDFDVIVSVDCGAKKLVSFHEKKPELFEGPPVEKDGAWVPGPPAKPFINIDHHESNKGYGTINLVDPQAAATAFIIFFFIRYAGWEITKNTATALMHGLYFDTGSFMHSNTNEYVLKVASELMAKGADFKRTAKELFHTTPLNKMRLWGRILERTYVNEDGVTVSAVNKHDYEVTDSVSGDTGGIIDFLNSVPGSKYTILLSEDERGMVKGSLRTQRDDVNLSDIAGEFGGGGHPKASGFGMPGRLEPQISWKVVGENGQGAHERDVQF
ncbi:bifunctional oligoribonuclease/PAP phosphatase NrnA [Candidatus Peregrinibacteria bacterium]|jgi:bifunctional oligoribonuclease and PAP phosphatase NrnA|nr:bifunctional oligoribonuclease/PAP phosphatase NrnA [Candidatus Peregrinibacteria bacterium]MBT4055959.1 bifunctional oligoribonuclease/PAP phosphatase NrnA [Candidatus Peregrinibacteria bacterium]